MSIESTIQRLTNDGEILVQFLVDTVQGNTRHATVSHRLKSTEWLAKFGGFISETDITPPTAPKRANSKSKPGKPDKNSQVTEKQILNYEIARLIKQETRNGESIIEFLVRVVLNGENFTTAARMRAVKELLFRGFGSTSPYSRRTLSGSTENLGSEFSKLIRECADFGAQSVTFLIEAMENKTPGGASKGFTASQRVWAACELMRRAYDIRTDHITPEDIQAYRNAQAQPPADAAETDANASAQKTANSNGATRADRRRQQRADRKSQNLANHSAEKPVENPGSAIVNTEKTANADGNSDHANSATANRENRADSAQKPVEPSVNAAGNTEKPVENTASAATTTENPAISRAARRRQQRADRKAQKRSPHHSDSAPDAQTPEDFQAELDAFIAFANANDIPYFILESEEPEPSETAQRKPPNPTNYDPDDP